MSSACLYAPGRLVSQRASAEGYPWLMKARDARIESRLGRRALIHPAMTVRQVATDYPACRAIFRRHGEPERGSAKFGHLEPLDHFARRHGIPLETLLAELSQAAGVEISRDAPSAGQAHRPFVATALAVTLSLGAGWGMLLLFEIGRRGSLVAVPAAQVVAHGEAQLWGFIVPFIVGIAVSFLPRTTARPRPHRALLALLLGALVTGVLGGFAWSLAARRWPGLGLASGFAQLAAALGFLAVIAQQLAGKVRAPWARFILAAAVWMTIWAVVDLALRGRAGPAGPGAYSESARRLVVKLALFGFALNAVYGFGQRLLPGMLGGGAPRAGAIEATFGLHNLGVLALAVSHVRWPSLCATLGASAIAAGAAAWAVGLRGFHSARRSASRPEAGPPFLARYIQLAFFLAPGRAGSARGRPAQWDGPRHRAAASISRGDAARSDGRLPDHAHPGRRPATPADPEPRFIGLAASGGPDLRMHRHRQRAASHGGTGNSSVPDRLSHLTNLGGSRADGAEPLRREHGPDPLAEARPAAPHRAGDADDAGCDSPGRAPLGRRPPGRLGPPLYRTGALGARRVDPALARRW